MSQDDRALIIGVGTYRAGFDPLTAVSSDVREVGRLLGSAQGSFKSGNVTVLTDQDADCAAVLRELELILSQAPEDQTVFVYMAGHGAVVGDKYYFLAHDTDRRSIDTTAIPLPAIKKLFDDSRSKRLFLWLDFCHCGGILARGIDQGVAEGEFARSIERALKVQGEGRVIMCACCPEQYAWEDGANGHYTSLLVAGLRGDAANAKGEITVNLLHDYIVGKMPPYQQPMMFGEMRGSLVLMHSRAASVPAAPVATAPPAPPKPSATVVEETGNLILLNGRFYKSVKVQHEAKGDIAIQVASENAHQEAELHELKGTGWSNKKTVAFAHRNDGMLAEVSEVSSEYQNDKLIWTVRLRPEAPESYSSITSEISTSEGGRSISADDIAEMRGRRLLLCESLAARGAQGSMLESLVQGLSTRVKAKEGVLAVLTPKPAVAEDPTEFLKTARLLMLFMLRATGVYERILELKLGPVVNNKVHVRCVGRRRAIFTNRPGTEVTIEGDCPL